MVLLKLIKAIEETMQLSWFWKRLREMKLSTYFRLDRNKVWKTEMKAPLTTIHWDEEYENELHKKLCFIFS